MLTPWVWLIGSVLGAVFPVLDKYINRLCFESQKNTVFDNVVGEEEHNGWYLRASFATI